MQISTLSKVELLDSLISKSVEEFGKSPSTIYMSEDDFKELEQEVITYIQLQISDHPTFMGLKIIKNNDVVSPIVALPERSDGIISVTFKSNWRGSIQSHPMSKDVMDLILGEDDIRKVNGRTFRSNVSFKNGSVTVTSEVSGVKISTNAYPASSCTLKEILKNYEKAYKAASAIPKGVKIIPPPQYKLYDGKVISGWLFDSQCEVIGIKQPHGTITGYSCAIIWESTPEKISELTTYPTFNQ